MVSHGFVLPSRGVVMWSESRNELSSRIRTDVIGLGAAAETHGFDSVWVGDSVLARPRLEPLTTLAAVGAVTDAVELGTAVYLPALRHPVNVAHLTSTLDLLSGGRLLLGVGAGSSHEHERAEYGNLGVPVADRGRVLDEAIDVIAALWSGTPVDYDGEHFQLSAASIGFGPRRDPPIYFASIYFDPREAFPDPILDRIVTHGAGWIPLGLSPAEYSAGLDAIRRAGEAAGRDMAGFDPALYFDVVIDDSTERALAAARDFMERYYPWWEGTDEDIEARGAFGDLGTVEAHMDEYRDAGVETFIVRFLSVDQRDQLRRYAALVD